MVLWMAAGLAASCGVASAAPLVLHVAPDGNDANPGTAERPLATPRGARDALRARRAADGLPKEGAVVEFADGVYRLQEPLALEKADSGAPGAPVVWRAKNRAKAVFSGAYAPKGWQPVLDEAAHALLPDGARAQVLCAELPAGLELPGFRGGGCGTPGHLQETPLSLFQGGTRCEPARWPNAGFARTGENIGAAEKRHDATFSKSGVFRFDSPRMEKWAQEPELWTYGLWCYEWADAKAQVKAVDLQAKTLAVDPGPIGFGIRQNAQFHVFNALSELDRPGEWVVDRAKRTLYLWPKDGGTPELAVAKGLVRAKDLSDVAFEGLVFEGARTTAISFANATRCAVRASVVRNTSSWAVTVNGGRDCRVEGCDLYELGEGGVSLAGGDKATLTPGGHVAENNHIHHYGRVVPNYRPGVSLNGVGNRCAHNLIHHTLNQAVTFGGNDQYVGFNVIHDACMFNDDAGAIYCCQRDWSLRGSVVEHNLVHMTGRPDRLTHTDAIYLDDFSSGIRVTGNVVNRAALGLHLGGGQDNLIASNVFVNCRRPIGLESRGIDSFARPTSEKGRESALFKILDKGRKLYEGPLWSARYPRMMKVFEFPDAQHAHDAHFNRIVRNVCLFGGVDKHNWANISNTCTVAENLELREDPGFEDYARFGWNLKPGAARDLVGDLRVAEMGLYASPWRVSPAVRFGNDVTPPRAIGPVYAAATVRIDLYLPGKLPAGLDAVATDCRGCEVPAWGRGARVMAGWGLASAEKWRDYSFTFTPAADLTLILETMGSRGEKTLYDAFKVEGAELKNGGFEEPGVWGGGKPYPGDYRAPVCNLKPPYGVLTAAEAGVPAAEGRKMACGSDMINFQQALKLKKGVPVRISFKARALPLGK